VIREHQASVSLALQGYLGPQAVLVDPVPWVLLVRLESLAPLERPESESKVCIKCRVILVLKIILV